MLLWARGGGGGRVDPYAAHTAARRSDVTFYEPFTGTFTFTFYLLLLL